MILYFTATGNSRWIAELLAEAMHDTAVSIVDCLKQGSIPAGLSTADRLGIVFPVHSWYAPRVLIDFCRSSGCRTAVTVIPCVHAGTIWERE